jgi:hypothetical protein
MTGAPMNAMNTGDNPTQFEYPSALHPSALAKPSTLCEWLWMLGSLSPQTINPGPSLLESGVVHLEPESEALNETEDVGVPGEVTVPPGECGVKDPVRCRIDHLAAMNANEHGR